MTLLPAMAVAILAAAATAEPDAIAAPPPIDDAPPAIPGAPPPIADVPVATDAPPAPELPQVADLPLLPPPALPAPRPRAPREFHLTAGYQVLDLMDLQAAGFGLRFATSLRSQALTLFVLELAACETPAGLPLRSASFGVEVWTDPASVARVGMGTDLGALGYQRATTGAWELHLAPGVRAGVEVAVLPIGSGALFLGVHGALRVGPWLSGTVSIGFRGHPADQAAW